MSCNRPRWVRRRGRKQWMSTSVSGIYTPVDYGYPDNGVLAIGELNQAQWVYAEIDLGSIAHIRQTGQVFNYRDWPGQFRHV